MMDINRWMQRSVDEKRPYSTTTSASTATSASTSVTVTTTPTIPPTFKSTYRSPVIKYLVLGFSILFWILGFIFVTVGYYITDETGSFLYDFIVDPGAVVKFLGVVVILISMCGVVGAFRENIFLLTTYKYLLIGTLFLQMFTGFLTFAFFPEIKKMVNATIVDGIRQYWDNSDLRDYIDNMQQSYECCGGLFVDDWDSNAYFNCAMKESYRSCGVPWSCCRIEVQRNLECGYGVRRHQRRYLEERVHTVGCLDIGFELFKSTLSAVGGLCVAFAILLLGDVCLIHVLVKQIKKEREKARRENGSEEQLQVFL